MLLTRFLLLSRLIGVFRAVESSSYSHSTIWTALLAICLPCCICFATNVVDEYKYWSRHPWYSSVDSCLRLQGRPSLAQSLSTPALALATFALHKMQFNKFFNSVLLAVLCASAATASPLAPGAKHATHRVREVSPDLKLETFHPESSYQVSLHTDMKASL